MAKADGRDGEKGKVTEKGGEGGKGWPQQESQGGWTTKGGAKNGGRSEQLREEPQGIVEQLGGTGVEVGAPNTADQDRIS